MRETEVIFQKRHDGAWFFKDSFDRYAPFQRVQNTDMLYVFLDLNFERTSPQTRMASYVLVQAFTDDEQAQVLRECLHHLFEPQTIKDSRPRCRYEQGGSIPDKYGRSMTIPAHHSSRMTDQDENGNTLPYWECPVCGWAKEKGRI